MNLRDVVFLFVLVITPHSRADTVPTISGFQLPDSIGRAHSLAELAEKKLVVVAFLGTECPLARLYAGRLQTIADRYADRGVAVVGIMPNTQDSLSKIAEFVRVHKLSYPVLKDRRNEVADLFGANRTPQVFLLDSSRAIRYQGRIDDQYLEGLPRDKATHEDLQNAIDELLADKDVSAPKTEALGCIIGRAKAPNLSLTVTYAHDVAPILNARCVECHRAGEIGPFALTAYEDAAGWGEMVSEVVRNERMPPWHADPQYGSFTNDRRMPDAEKQLIYKWVENGCPAGDAADLPKSPTYTPGWQLPREPDLVFAMKEPFTVPASGGPGGVPYQYFRVESGFTDDKWIAAGEVQPGNRAVVHHTIVYVEPPGSSGRSDWIFLFAYVPGLRLDPLPAQSAKRVPAGSTLIFEQHYTPNGVEQQDTTRVGFNFANENEVENEVITIEIGDRDFTIPPKAAKHLVTATSRPIGTQMTLLSMSPHMHLRGKSFRYELVSPSGDREVLLNVPSYDFNWQTRYRLAKPISLPEGSMLFCSAVFDNSKDNLANPDPKQSVRWGEQTWEEMMLGFCDVMLPRDDKRKAGRKPIKTGLDVVGLFDAADIDHDSALDESEASGNEVLKENFAELDQNHDGLLRLNEILAGLRKLSARN
jgi:peroxiredoxin